MTVILATHNSFKVREMKAILSEADTVMCLKDIGYADDIIEDGATFEENAVIKARAVLNWLNTKKCAAAGLPPVEELVIVADDSGLEIDAMDKQPGVYSARYLGYDTPYSEKNRHIIEQLRDVPDEKRTARFVCVIACIRHDRATNPPEPKFLISRGELEGRIAHELQGTGGFGYDPIFFLPECGRTLSELPADEKNRISHRSRALGACTLT